MPSATETVLAENQSLQRSQEFIGDSIQKGYAAMSAAESRKTDVQHQLFQSALALKQQQINTYFSQQNLELQTKQLALDNTYKMGMLDAKKQELDQHLQIAQVDAENRARGKENSAIKGSIGQQVLIEGKKVSLLQSNFDDNNNNIKLNTKDLQTYFNTDQEKFHGPEGDRLRSQIDELTSKNSEIKSNLSKAAGNLDAFQFASNQIGMGADPKPILEGLYSRNPEFEQSKRVDPALLEKRGFSEQINKSINGIPSSSIREPIKPEVEQIKPVGSLPIEKTWGAINSDSPDVTPYARSQAYKLTNDAGKKIIDAKANSSLKSALLTFGSINSYGDPQSEHRYKDSQGDDVLKSSQADFLKYQGGADRLALTMSNAKDKLTDLVADKSFQGTEADSKGEIVPDGNINWKKIRAKYTDWVNEQTNPVVDSPSGTNVLGSNGKLFNVETYTATPLRLTPKTQIPLRTPEPKSLDSSEIITREYPSPEKKQRDREQAKEKEIQTNFDNNYIKDGKLNRQKFYDWATSESGPNNAELGHFAYKLKHPNATSSSIPYSVLDFSDEDRTNLLKSITPEQAIKLYNRETSAKHHARREQSKS